MPRRASILISTALCGLYYMNPCPRLFVFSTNSIEAETINRNHPRNHKTAGPDYREISTYLSASGQITLPYSRTECVTTMRSLRLLAVGPPMFVQSHSNLCNLIERVGNLFQVREFSIQPHPKVFLNRFSSNRFPHNLYSSGRRDPAFSGRDQLGLLSG